MPEKLKLTPPASRGCDSAMATLRKSSGVRAPSTTTTTRVTPSTAVRSRLSEKRGQHRRRLTPTHQSSRASPWLASCPWRRRTAQLTSCPWHDAPHANLVTSFHLEDTAETNPAYDADSSVYVMSFVHGRDCIHLAPVSLQRQDTLIGAFCQPAR